MPGATPTWCAAVLSALSLAGGVLGDPAGEGDAPPPVDFARQVRPLLSDRCFACHGPDEHARKGRLRLDTLQGATAARRASPPAVVPGDAAGSALAERVLSDDPYERMPPEDSGKQLSRDEALLLARWIDEGAPWTQHWSFLPPVRPQLPAVERPALARNPIDLFILDRLADEGLEPAPSADGERLLRRVSFDLTGLPPTLAELDTFLADDAPDAYESAVERLLASPRYGEQQARRWLDAARYGDTHGLHLDNERSMWRYRDWVIAAFNANRPFDEFTVEQLAGDLLPEATLDQRIATGFNRCNPTTAEGGLIAAEYLAKYAMDRVDTTASVFMGLTMGCAQCHDHKFDPFAQREYYRLFAYFNNVAEEASDGNIAAPPPLMAAPRPDEAHRLAGLRSTVLELERGLVAPMPEVDGAQEGWLSGQSARVAARWQPLIVRTAKAGGSTLTTLEDGSLLSSGANPQKDVYEIEADCTPRRVTALQLRTLRHESLPLGGTGRADNSNFVLTGIELERVRPDGISEARAFAAALADHSQPGFEVSSTIDDDPASGWAVSYRPEERMAVFLLDRPIELQDGEFLRVTLRHESAFAQHGIGRLRLSVADDPTLLLPQLGPWYEAGPFAAEEGAALHTAPFWPEASPSGEQDLAAKDATGAWRWRLRPDLGQTGMATFPADVSAVYLYREILTREAGRFAVGLGSDDSLRVWLNGELVHDRDVGRGLVPGEDQLALQLRAGANHLLVKVVNRAGSFAFAFQREDDGPEGFSIAVEHALLLEPGARSTAQQDVLREHFRASESPAWAALRSERDTAARALAEFEATLPTTMVMAERVERRPAQVLQRGQYDRPGETVAPGVPAILPPLPADAPADRLGLARWLVAPGHPLTARVTVNRLWQEHFGIGLVRTSNDFGSQGEFPSHPQLLDWLAVELIESGWDLKHMHRLMVNSATYRQSARMRPELLERDPHNRLLARGPRLRLDAEEIRDAALAVSGLLVETLGGPSVRPYQPPGIWEAVGYVGSNTQKFTPDSGDKLYRRSLYTFWKRTAPPPSMTLFDAPSRETCSLQRARTNTPLQALVVQNDVQFVEAARCLGQRALREGGSDDAARIEFLFRLATARRPDAEERALLLELLGDLRGSYAQDPQAAQALRGVGESPYEAQWEPSELAAWSILASTLLNLDEALTRG